MCVSLGIACQLYLSSSDSDIFRMYPHYFCTDKGFRTVCEAEMFWINLCEVWSFKDPERPCAIVCSRRLASRDDANFLVCDVPTDEYAPQNSDSVHSCSRRLGDRDEVNPWERRDPRRHAEMFSRALDFEAWSAAKEKSRNAYNSRNK